MTISNPVTSASIAAEFGFSTPWTSDQLYSAAGAGPSAPRTLQSFAGFSGLEITNNGGSQTYSPGTTDFQLTVGPANGAGSYTYSWFTGAGSTQNIVFTAPNSQTTTCGTGDYGGYVCCCTVTDAWGAQRLYTFNATTVAPQGSNPGGGGGGGNPQE